MMFRVPRELDDGDALVRNDALLITEVDGELIAMSVENGFCYGLDRVGTRIWAHLGEPMSVGALVEQLTREFDVEEEVCRHDVKAVLKELIEERLLLTVAA